MILLLQFMGNDYRINKALGKHGSFEESFILNQVYFINHEDYASFTVNVPIYLCVTFYGDD